MKQEFALPAHEARAVEHLESALLQGDPRRRLALVALALKASPGSPLAHGVLALSLPALDDAARHLEVACKVARTPKGPELSPALGTVRTLCLAVRDLAAQDAHSSLERTSPLLRGEASGPLAVALVRTHLAAAAACGDMGQLAAGLAHAGRMPEAFVLELPWFAYLLASAQGKPEAGALAAKAGREAGVVLDGVVKPAPETAPGNVGYLGKADGAIARGAVLPGLCGPRTDWTAFAAAA